MVPKKGFVSLVKQHILTPNFSNTDAWSVALASNQYTLVSCIVSFQNKQINSWPSSSIWWIGNKGQHKQRPASNATNGSHDKFIMMHISTATCSIRATTQWCHTHHTVDQSLNRNTSHWLIHLYRATFFFFCCLYIAVSKTPNLQQMLT